MPATLTKRRFNVDEYYRMADAGIFAPGERVELIDGEIVRMEPIGSLHASCVTRLMRILMMGLAEKCDVRVQCPVRLGDFSEPEPDIAVVRSRSDDYAEGHPMPADVLLIVEVAHSTVDFDRELKARLYAEARVTEYWVVSLPEERIEVFREPHEGRYHKISAHRRDEVLHAMAFPEIDLPVSEVLPPRAPSG